MDKVSVIITTYNSERTIQRTLNSVKSQIGYGTIFDMEIIVVDDCSTDSTQQILRNNEIPFLTTSSNSGGPNKGRNIGLHHATGNFICFIDHDDTWDPNKTILQLNVAQSYPIVSTGYQIINTATGKHTPRCNNSSTLKVYAKNETFLNKLSRTKGGQNVYFSTLMISSSLKHVLFEEHYGMVDYDWLLRLFHNQPSAEIPLGLMTRLITSNNLSLNENYRRKDFLYSHDILLQYKHQYPTQVDNAIKRLYGSAARYHYLCNNMEEARKYFRKAALDAKNILYYLTSFVGGRYVRKYFNVFG